MSLFSYVSIEDRIPANHPLRRIRKLGDQALDRLNPTFCRLYTSEGRPSVPPEQLLLASLLQAFYGIRSERLLLDQLHYNLLFHWFVGQRKISLAVQSRPGAICRSRLLTVTTTLRQQGRDVWQFMEQAWIAHHRGGVVAHPSGDPAVRHPAFPFPVPRWPHVVGGALPAWGPGDPHLPAGARPARQR